MHSPLLAPPILPTANAHPAPPQAAAERAAAEKAQQAAVQAQRQAEEQQQAAAAAAAVIEEAQLEGQREVSKLEQVAARLAAAWTGGVPLRVATIVPHEVHLRVSPAVGRVDARLHGAQREAATDHGHGGRLAGVGLARSHCVWLLLSGCLVVTVVWLQHDPLARGPASFKQRC